MFKEETVFILGAGASKPYGYPLGKELIIQIIKNIEDDQIYLPILEKTTGEYFYNESDGIEKNEELINGYMLDDFKEYFAKTPIEITNNINKFRINSYNPITIKLKQINELFNLKKKHLLSLILFQ